MEKMAFIQGDVYEGIIVRWIHPNTIARRGGFGFISAPMGNVFLPQNEYFKNKLEVGMTIRFTLSMNSKGFSAKHCSSIEVVNKDNAKFLPCTIMNMSGSNN